jgi:hypothetical protein
MNSSAPNADFVIETTLANLTYAQKLPLWQRQGYRVSLIYIHLSSVDVALARVRKRVEAGGHDIPASALRRRLVGARNISRPFISRSSTRGTNGTAMRAHSRCEISEDGMNQKAEIERMQAAFNRAAEKATRGTREERSGRFEVRDDSRLTRGDEQRAKPRRGSKPEK